MNVSLITVFPELYDTFLKTSLMQRASEKKLVHYDVDGFFSYVQPKERIDAPTFGHGAGMLIRPEVIEKALDDKEARYGKAYKIFFSPQGKKLNQPLLKQIVQNAQKTNHLMLIASRYEGMDDRVEQVYADLVVSVGDFVLLAGDLPAMMLLEGFVRLLPGVVGRQESVEKESFSGPFVDYPEFTTPVVWHDLEVPEVIRSGNHGAIQKWQEEKAAEKTVKKHFSWLVSSLLTQQQKKIARTYIPHHYIALMHDQVMLPQQQVGTTSVTSLDIHDIARSACTFGLKQYFIVTPLLDQQRIVEKLLDFWKVGEGVEYNQHRHQAIKNVEVVDHLEQALEAIEKKEGKKPLVIATSARYHDDHFGKKIITYSDQNKVWEDDRPVLLLFGTGHGIAPQVLERCDYLLAPIEGFSDFNHLSVRSAVAIILDRWLGINPKVIG